MMWHGRPLLWHFAVAAILLATIQHSHCVGELSVSIHYWAHTGSQACDRGFLQNVGGKDRCDSNLELKLSQHGTGDLLNHKQGLGEFVQDQNIVAYSNIVGGTQNPLRVKLPRNTGEVEMTITVIDVDGNGQFETLNKFTARLTTIRDSGDIGLYSEGIKYSYSFKCEPEDTDQLCIVQCKPHDDDISGHNTCDSAGYVVCLSGWMGSGCNVPLPCGASPSTSPCKNNGKCEVIDDVTFKCHCTDGHWGSRCEKYFKPCAATPCKNGGTCRADRIKNDFVCDCRAGLIGNFCETDKMRCTSNLCQNGATCEDVIGGFTCTCAAGFIGEKCHIDIDECALGSPCVNGGTCVNTHGSFKCLCPSGLDGDWCQYDVNECENASLCRADETCLNTPRSYACVVIDRDDCDGVECAHGGTCVDREYHYICLCLPGYTGPTCSVSSHHKLVENL